MYIAGITCVNHILPLRSRVAVKLNFRPYIRRYTSPNENLLQLMPSYSKPCVKYSTVKPVLSSHSKRTQKLVFKTDYHLMQVKSIAECSKGSILPILRPSLSYHIQLRPLFCIFVSGRLRRFYCIADSFLIDIFLSLPCFLR